MTDTQPIYSFEFIDFKLKINNAAKISWKSNNVDYSILIYRFKKNELNIVEFSIENYSCDVVFDHIQFDSFMEELIFQNNGNDVAKLENFTEEDLNKLKELLKDVY